MTFGSKLKFLREKVGYRFTDFWKAANISKVYLNSIESDMQVPPPEKQELFMDILEKKGCISDQDKKEYFDLAANKRNEIPADILLFYKNNRFIAEDFRRVIGEKCNE